MDGSDFVSNNLGYLAGLAASLMWASASVLYTRVAISAAALTLYKNILAAVLMGATLFVVTRSAGEPFSTASSQHWWLLGWSAIIGLWIGDIGFFRSLQILGPRKALTLTLITPPITAFLSGLMLGEQMKSTEWLAMLVTLFGISIVLIERSQSDGEGDGGTSNISPSGSLRWGYACSAVGILGQSIGSIIMKMGTDGVGSMEATFIRLAVAAVIGLAMLPLSTKIREIVNLRNDLRGTGQLTIAALLGTYLGVWFMLTAFKMTPAGVAATLTSTSPLFVIPIVWLFLSERVSGKAVAGALIAFSGVCMFFALTSVY